MAEGITEIDDERIRVTTWTFGAEGDAIGRHVHEYDYVVVPVTGGTFTVTEADGETTRRLEQRAGEAYLGKAGTEHDVANAGSAPASFVEIELKR